MKEYLQSSEDLTKMRDLRMGVVYPSVHDGIASAIHDTLDGLGCECASLLHDAAVQEDLDVVLAHGPMRSLVPIANQLLAFPLSRRPAFVLWMTEPLPSSAWPAQSCRLLGAVRSWTERLAYHQTAQGEWRVYPFLRWMTKRAMRLRIYGDLYWLRRQGLLSVLAVGSQWICGYLRSRGFDAVEAYLGYHPSWGTDLGLQRDIPVLWMGKLATRRRRRILERIRSELGRRGVEILMIDGIENPYVFGEERTVLLNRAKIVLNVLRNEGHCNAIRYFFAAPNNALIVTEPTLAHTPFVPGRHLVEAPLEQIGETISYYLSHEEERRLIAARAHRLVTTELTMKEGVRRILDRIRT